MGETWNDLSDPFAHLGTLRFSEEKLQCFEDAVV